jgi:hypothetical protein
LALPQVPLTGAAAVLATQTGELLPPLVPRHIQVTVLPGEGKTGVALGVPGLQ